MDNFLNLFLPMPINGSVRLIAVFISQISSPILIILSNLSTLYRPSAFFMDNLTIFSLCLESFAVVIGNSSSVILNCFNFNKAVFL